MSATSIHSAWNKRAVAVFVLLLLFATGAYAGIASQASALDYRLLYMSVVPYAAVHSLLLVAYVAVVRHWSRWIALAFGAVALCSFGEFTWRVWFYAG
jgi:hypothetical protein